MLPSLYARLCDCIVTPCIDGPEIVGPPLSLYLSFSVIYWLKLLKRVRDKGPAASAILDFMIPLFLLIQCLIGAWFQLAPASHCMPPFAALVCLHSRREEQGNVGAFKYPCAAQRHTELINAKLQSKGIPAWQHRNWHLRRKGDELQGSAFWQERSVARGHIALLALFDGPFQWMAGPLSLHSSERRFLADVAHLDARAHLAFTSVLRVVAVSDFCNVVNVPSPIHEKDNPDLIPLLWSEKRQEWHSNPKKDLIAVPPETTHRCADWLCCHPTKSGEDIALQHHVGTVREVLDGWANAFGCRQQLQITAFLQLPPPLVMLLGHQIWKDIGAIFHTKSTRNGFSIDKVSLGLRPHGEPPARQEQQQDDEPVAQISAERLTCLADDLRVWAAGIQEEQPSNHIDDLRCSATYLAGWCEWADACERQLTSEELLCSRRQGRQRMLDNAVLFASLWLSYNLRSDRDLKSVGKDTLMLLCPGTLQAWLHNNVDFLVERLPSASTISRSRFPFDCSWQLWWQRHMQESFSKEGVFTMLMVDATPMFGREWLLACYETCLDIEKQTQCMHSLFAVWNAAREGRLEQDGVEAAMDMWAMEEHICVPTGLGSARASLPHKIHALLHMLALDCGSWPLVSQYCDSVAVITSDMGTEGLLASAQHDDLTPEFYPKVGLNAIDNDTRFWSELSRDVEDGGASPEPGLDDHDAQGARQEGALGKRLFRNALWIPGVLHILHSCSGALTAALPHFEEFLTKLRPVVRFLSNPMLVERFAENCLEGQEESQVFKEHFQKAISCSLAEWRWMTLIHSVKCVLSRMLPLRVFYRLDKMLFRHWAPNNDLPPAEDDPRAASGENDNNGILRDCATSFQDVMFWAYCRLVLNLEIVLSDVEALAYSCPCHPQRLQQLRDKRQRGKLH